MVFVIAICPQAVLLIVPRMTRDPLIGVDLLDVVRGIFVSAAGGLHTITGTIGRGLGGWMSGGHDEGDKEKGSLNRCSRRNFRTPPGECQGDPEP